MSDFQKFFTSKLEEPDIWNFVQFLPQWNSASDPNFVENNLQNDLAAITKLTGKQN